MKIGDLGSSPTSLKTNEHERLQPRGLCGRTASYGVVGAVLPGDSPGVVTVGAFGAPVGAGEGDDMLLVVAGAAMLPEDIVLGAGAVLPGEVPGVVTTGAFGAPVGAGLGLAVCAQANPAETINAAEASKIERILIS